VAEAFESKNAQGNDKIHLHASAVHSFTTAPVCFKFLCQLATFPM
jgi:hypothetical protein